MIQKQTTNWDTYLAPYCLIGKMILTIPLHGMFLPKKPVKTFSKTRELTVILHYCCYGDFNNWFAAFAFWVLKYYGYEDIRLINGGRKKWLQEDRAVTKDVPSYPKGNFAASEPDSKIRVFLDEVKRAVNAPGLKMVDVRSPKEFSGEILAPPEYPTEHAQRGGHIPGALNIPWAQAVNDSDGTFKNTEELKQAYTNQKGLPPIRRLSLIVESAKGLRTHGLSLNTFLAIRT